jgi:NADH-quinone oxidoreductase subunit L
MMIWGGWITLLSPLAGALVITLAGTRIGRRTAGYIATASTMIAFVAAVVAFVVALGKSPDARSQLSTAYTWIAAGSYQSGFSILIDQLSILMMLIVTGVGSLIIAYSLGYMEGEDEERRYFAYMALFVFSMLLLVEGGNLILLLAGWGMVGLSSYLLIGFYHQRASAVAAAKKAFVMNAVGDATMAVALFLLIKYTGSLSYAALGQVPASNRWVVNLVALGLLGGAVAKSAQLPLQTWLPDAMEGPTPVSALIHAATMVTAGVYLIVRCHVAFQAAPHVQDLAAVLGTVTLVLAGLIALVQVDIKRVIAYSTMSQIGYMFLGAGIGAYADSMFHLMTHAFFKATLFLAAGLLIHALGGEQDLRKMGGLRKLMPFTFLAFLAGSLALAGIPPFSGFFSKDPIIASALARGGALGDVLWVAALAGAFLTGVYAFRLVFRVFLGEPSAFVREHLHTGHGEGPLSMRWTVGVLAVLATVAGFLQFPPFWTPVSNWLEPVAPPLVDPTNPQELTTLLIGVALGLAGIAVAWLLYGSHRYAVPRPRALLERKFYFDELYDAAFYRPATWVAASLRRFVEEPVVDGSIAEVAAGTRGVARWTGLLQTGLLRTYVLAIAASLAVLLVVFVAVR